MPRSLTRRAWGLLGAALVLPMLAPPSAGITAIAAAACGRSARAHGAQFLTYRFGK